MMKLVTQEEILTRPTLMASEACYASCSASMHHTCWVIEDEKLAFKLNIKSTGHLRKKIPYSEFLFSSVPPTHWITCFEKVSS